MATPAVQPRTLASRIFAALVVEKCKGTGTCFESQEGLAAELGTTTRNIRRFEADGVAAGTWRIQKQGRTRGLVLLDTGHPRPQSPTATPDTVVRTPDRGVPKHRTGSSGFLREY
jgi:hypothetical protein